MANNSPGLYGSFPFGSMPYATVLPFLFSNLIGKLIVAYINNSKQFPNGATTLAVNGDNGQLVASKDVSTLVIQGQ